MNSSKNIVDPCYHLLHGPFTEINCQKSWIIQDHFWIKSDTDQLQQDESWSWFNARKVTLKVTNCLKALKCPKANWKYRVLIKLGPHDKNQKACAIHLALTSIFSWGALSSSPETHKSFTTKLSLVCSHSCTCSNDIEGKNTWQINQNIKNPL